MTTGKKIFLLVILAAVTMLLFSCKVLKPGTDTKQTESTTIKYIPVEIPVTGAKVGASINLDSLYKAAMKIRAQYIQDSISAALAGKPIPVLPAQTKYVTDPETKAQLSYWIDQYGKLQIGCESKDQVVKLLAAEVTRLSKEVTKKTEIIKETPKWNWVLISVLGVLLIISVIVNVLLIKIK